MFSMVLIYILILILQKSHQSEVKIHHGTITNDSTWFVAPLHQAPVLFFEWKFIVEFPKTACCPIMDIYYTPKAYEKLQCYTDLAKSERVWYRNNIFFLEPLEGSLVKCHVKADNSTYQCTGRFKNQDYEPKMRWFTFGYLCSNNGTTSLKGLRYNLTMVKESNITTCEEMDLTISSSIKCSKFYSIVSFPNVFGDNNQVEASRSMDTFYARINTFYTPCHRDLELMLCQVFFPQCDIDMPSNSNETKNRSSLPMISQNLVHPCEELCVEIIRVACTEAFGSSFSAGATCTYFPSRNRSKLCIYNPLTCKRPNELNDGYFKPSAETYPPGSVVNYYCTEGFMIEGPVNSTCEYSGLWTTQPMCKPSPKDSNDDMTIYIALGISLALVFGTLFALVIAFALRRRKGQTLGITNINYRTDVLKSCGRRHKEHDAFISYFSEGSDDNFVRQFLHPKLEVQHDPPFKLLNHIRDFKADTLIYTNILNAIKQSNCAIIVLSQEYIDSRWCREEFEECMEENANDPAFRLFVILMEPLNKLKRLTAYMNKYLRSKTFLQSTDPKLSHKIAQYLKELRGSSVRATKSQHTTRY